MAVHPDHPKLSAEVVVDYEPLKEYDDDDDGSGDSRIVTKYVQVDDDAQFGVRFTVPKGLTGECGVRSVVKIDGKTVLSQTLPPQQLNKCDATRRIFRTFGYANGQKFTQNFQFSKLNIDEEESDADETMSKKLKFIGTITLKLSFINGITTQNLPAKQPSKSGRAEPKDKLPLLGVVAEKSLKGDARSHQASLGTPQFRSPYVGSGGQVSNTYDLGEPFAIFHFKYRSFSALKALQVIPRTPSPPPRSPNHHQQNDAVGFCETMQEASIKHETNTNEEVGEVEFVSNKRLKSLPTKRDEVIVLD